MRAGATDPEQDYCKVCEAPMISHWLWEKKGIRPEGFVPRGSRKLSLCRKHYQAHIRAEHRKANPLPPRREPDRLARRSREEVLEDYDMIRDDVDSVAQAAERMGMTFSALDTALYRARKLGDRRALPPPAQLERGLLYGVSRHLIQEAS